MISKKDILNCLPLLASALGNRYGVQVRIGGERAYTNGKIIQLPTLPLDCDKTSIALAKGYIDHESAHIRYTDFDCLWIIARKPVVRHLCNSIEDWRVENCLAKLYPGCRANLVWLIRHVFLEEETGEAGDKNLAFSVLSYVLLTVRSWDVPELAAPLAKVSGIIEKAFPGLKGQLDAVLAKVKQHCPDTQASVEYAIELAGLLKAYEKPENNQEAEKAESGKPDNRDQINESSSRTEAESPENSTSEAGELQEDRETQEGGNAEGRTEEERGRKNGIDNTNLKPEGKEGNREESKDIDGGSPTSRENSGLSDSAEENADALKSLFTMEAEELPDGFGELLAAKLGKSACAEREPGLEVAQGHERPLESLPMEEKSHALRCSNALRQRLSGLLQAQELKALSPARHGRLDMGKLYRLSTGSPTIFRKETIATGQSTAVHILLDASYSMEGKAIRLARQTCYALAKALCLIKGVNPAVTVFPDGVLGGVYPVLKHGAKLTDKFLVEACGGTPLAEALWWVAQTLVPLTEARKIVLVVTDGVPNNVPAAKDAIGKIQKLGLELYGLGIGLEAIKELFPGKSRVISELHSLPSAMFGLLQETLLKGGEL